MHELFSGEFYQIYVWLFVTISHCVSHQILYIFTSWMGLHIPLCFKNLQHLEQEGVVPPNLSSFGKKIAYMVTPNLLVFTFSTNVFINTYQHVTRSSNANFTSELHKSVATAYSYNLKRNERLLDAMA